MRVTELVGKVVVVQALTLFFFALTPSIVFAPARALRRRVVRLPLVARVSSLAFFTTVVLSIVSLTVTCEALLGDFCTQARPSQRCAAALTLSNILLTVALVFQTVALKAQAPSTRLARSFSLNVVFRMISTEESVAQALTTLALLRAATHVVSERWRRVRAASVLARWVVGLLVILVSSGAMKGSSYFVCTTAVTPSAGAAAVVVAALL